MCGVGQAETETAKEAEGAEGKEKVWASRNEVKRQNRLTDM